jgi:hypothetical protein
MKKLIFAFALLTTTTPAFAKGGSPQTHHCKMPDGTMDMAKTKKQCQEAKGTWAKDAAPSPSPEPAKK